MTIYVDADACPVIKQTERIAKERRIGVELICDTNHILESTYSKVTVVSAGADSVDFVLVNKCKRGDIVVTQDYGLAAMVLSKGARAIHQSGTVYTEGNIEGLLQSRYEVKKARCQSAKNHIKGPKKRTKDDDLRFENALICLIKAVKAEEN